MPELRNIAKTFSFPVTLDNSQRFVLLYVHMCTAVVREDTSSDQPSQMDSQEVSPWSKNRPLTRHLSIHEETTDGIVSFHPSADAWAKVAVRQITRLKKFSLLLVSNGSQSVGSCPTLDRGRIYLLLLPLSWGPGDPIR